jgi:hypothetical protein
MTMPKIRTRLDWEVIANDAAHMALYHANASRDPGLSREKRKQHQAKSSAWAKVSNVIREALELEEG